MCSSDLRVTSSGPIVASSFESSSTLSSSCPRDTLTFPRWQGFSVDISTMWAPSSSPPLLSSVTETMVLSTTTDSLVTETVLLQGMPLPLLVLTDGETFNDSSESVVPEQAYLGAVLLRVDLLGVTLGPDSKPSESHAPGSATGVLVLRLGVGERGRSEAFSRCMGMGWVERPVLPRAGRLLVDGAAEWLEAQLSTSDTSPASSARRLARERVMALLLRLRVTLWVSDAAELHESFPSSFPSSSDSTGIESDWPEPAALLVPRRASGPTLDADVADEQESTSERFTHGLDERPGVFLRPLRRIGWSTSDAAEQEDSESDTSASCVESSRWD